jgi:hypothetical protein
MLKITWRWWYIVVMKRRKKKPVDLLERFQTTCGWCGRAIPANSPVYGGGGKARPDIDLTDKAGQVIPVRLLVARKTVLVGVSGLDSEARRAGRDFVYMACSEFCGQRLQEAFQADIDLRKQADLP